MVNQNSTKRLISFVDNLEEKLLSVNKIHDQLYQLMSIVSSTHQTIIEDLTRIKAILNQTTIEQEDDQIIPIDERKSEWDEEDNDEKKIPSRKFNENVVERDNLTINSASSIVTSSTLENHKSSSTSKHSSSLKKTNNRLSSIIKSPKSVSFSLDRSLPNYEQKKLIPTFQQFSKDKKYQTLNEMSTSTIPSSSLDFSKQNQLEIFPNIGKTLTNVRIHEIESRNGDYLRLLNISNSDDYDLSEHFLQQILHSKYFPRFQFPFNTIIKAGQTITIWCGRSKQIIPQTPHIFIWKEQTKWETKPDCITILAKPNGQSIAWFRNSNRVNTDQSSSDILFLHSKTNSGSSDISSISSSSINDSHSSRNQHRFSAFHFFGSHKPPFAHSPNNPIHPDHNGTTVNIPNDIRSQMHQRSGIDQLFNRPKSSSFGNFTHWKQDSNSFNFLRPEKQKQTTVQT